MVTQRTLAKLGNKTRYGHIISASSTIFDEDHNPLVRAGDKAWCDVCKGAFEINATYTGFLEAGFIAGDGDLVLCHCKDNFVIAISGFTGERYP
ncbi:PAAR domain-containing protein [Citrobacter sp. HN-141]|uniref:PAAR domain-containing protein n=1 Tax=unclassified Citrobacter TaxID=2644389 RepID=UPI002963D8AA|nr:MULTISPECIES: PAAR domain-containing protein [unclassified Citrobacter]MDW2644944.1 PAAR domain-containing protein [Citrobacter sp. HN-141]MDW2654494.1 PAAR domain-containing protein [Citrobacter sp. HN-120]MDW2697656.1 PAAR domain-containing protein [Citrobacter sp. HN-144]